MLSIFLLQSNRIGGNQVSVLSKPISVKVPVSMALGAVDDLKKSGALTSPVRCLLQSENFLPRSILTHNPSLRNLKGAVFTEALNQTTVGNTLSSEAIRFKI